MSQWVENQLQEGFNLWRRYLALTLHFKAGSSFDYTLYRGATNATITAFRRKPPDERLRFIRLANKLNSQSIDVEEFLFANFRYREKVSIFDLVDDKSIVHYRTWKELFSDEQRFNNTVSKLFRFVKSEHQNNFNNIDHIVSHLLRDNKDQWLELIVWLLKRDPDVLTRVRQQETHNILFDQRLSKVVKCQKMYSYLLII